MTLRPPVQQQYGVEPLSKCKLFGPGASCVDPAFDEIPRVSFSGGTLVLGVPVGSNDFTVKHVDDVCAKLAHLAKRIGLLKQGGVEH